MDIFKENKKHAIIKKLLFSFVVAAVLAVWVVSLSACNSNKNDIDKALYDAKDIVSRMSLDEKVGQLFIVQPEALDPHYTADQIKSDSTAPGVKAANDDIINNIDKYHPGGLVMFDRNLSNPEQTLTFVQKLQSKSKTRMFLALDEEGGALSRIANNSTYGEQNVVGGMQEVGRQNNKEVAHNVGERIGGYLTSYGFNLNFAPVCDIKTDDKGNSIPDRYFGYDADLVSNMVAPIIEGFHVHKIMATCKHFPGAGAATVQTQNYPYVIDKSWNEMKDFEIKPFTSAIDAGVDFAMVTHVAYPDITGNNTPASLSKEIVTEKLRKELNFKGVIITEDMSMPAMTKLYSSGEAAVKAIQAGADICLMPDDFAKAYDAVMDAVRSDTITRQELDDHVTHIIAAKKLYDLVI